MKTQQPRKRRLPIDGQRTPGRFAWAVLGAILTGITAGCGSSTFNTTTALFSDPNPSVAGQLVSVQAKVNYTTRNPFPISNPVTKSVPEPGGTVTLTDTSTVPATVLDTEPVSNGVANFTLLSLLPGNHALQATFNGYAQQILTFVEGGPFGITKEPATFTTTYTASTSSLLAQLVGTSTGTATTTQLTSSLSPSGVGQAVTFTATVGGLGSGGAMPTGTVTFLQGKAVLETVPLSGGTAAYTTSALPLGSTSIAAYYSGDSSNIPSSANMVQQVVPFVTTTLISSTATSVGQSVTFTATVTSTDGSTPTGTAQFAVDGTDVGSAVTLDAHGQATDTESDLTLGTHTVSVTFAPTGAFQDSLGTLTAAVTQNVGVDVSPQYVSPTGSDTADGSSGSPKQTIQAAINATKSGDTVIVEPGTYSGDGNRDLDFGGRNLTVEAAASDPAQTVLDCGGSDTAEHRGFFFHSGETGAVVRGLTLENGYESHGSGVSASPSGGGGAVAVASGSTASLADCVFTANQSALRGGGVYNDGTLTLTGCTFTGNTTLGTSSDGGGGLYNLGTVTALNCTFTGNSALQSYGGGITNSGPALFAGCTVTGNTADDQGGGVFNNGTATLTDDIIYGNTGGELQYDAGSAAVTCCDIEGGYDGAAIIDADPLFVGAGDFHLQAGSPCRSAGTPVPGLPTDKDGRLRPYPPALGAYEGTQGVAASHLLWAHTSGMASLWNIGDPNPAATCRLYGPYPGWTPQAIAQGPDGTVRLLWTHDGGLASLWNLADANPAATCHVYGPFAGWTAKALTVGPDNAPHLLWGYTDGTRLSLEREW